MKLVCIYVLYVAPIQMCSLRRHGIPWWCHPGSAETCRQETVCRLCLLLHAWISLFWQVELDITHDTYNITIRRGSFSATIVICPSELRNSSSGNLFIFSCRGLLLPQRSADNQFYLLSCKTKFVYVRATLLLKFSNGYLGRNRSSCHWIAVRKHQKRTHAAGTRLLGSSSPPPLQIEQVAPCDLREVTASWNI
jgi:hypothetical protein